MQVTIQIRQQTKDKAKSVQQRKTFSVAAPVGLAALLRDEGILLDYDCGKRGLCGKCRVLFLTGAPEPTAAERACLTPAELQEGYRLACVCTVGDDCEIVVQQRSDTMQTVGYDQGVSASAVYAQEAQRNGVADAGKSDEKIRPTTEYGVAIDLGTTTLAFALVDRRRGQVVRTYCSSNSQRMYGADVMSRMERANAGDATALQACIIRDLTEGVLAVCSDLFAAVLGQTTEESLAVLSEVVSEIVIAGNTTMCHLLLGYSCESLATAPFVPVSIAQKTFRYQQIAVTILPGVSAFIGADIVAGMYGLEFDRQREPVMLLDFGTNGEMVLWTGKEYMATSVAAGPAFEGGNISCGCPSVYGAVCGVTIARDKSMVQTIGGVPAIGICGSGLLEAVHGMRRNRLLDENGTMTDAYRQDGYALSTPGAVAPVVITQEDVRQFQMAKSAVATGQQMLLEKAGIQARQIGQVCLAGGMGTYMSVSAAVGVGLLPEVLGRCGRTVGNTSLQGAVAFLLHREEASARMREMIARTQVISLAEEADFEAEYLRHMALRPWRL